MAADGNLIEALLNDINNGKAGTALPRIEELLFRAPDHAGLLTLRAEALRVTGRDDEAIAAFRLAGEKGVSARNWMVAGIMLALHQRIEEAIDCLRKAHAIEPDNDEILNSLVTTLFNANRYNEGVDFARRLLALSHNEQYLSNAALLLQSNQSHQEAADIFKKIVGHAGGSPQMLGAALVPARFTCEWQWTESLQKRIGAFYAKGQFAATHEFPLTHLTWCSNERFNLEVTRAYVERVLTKVTPLAPGRPLPPDGRRIRVGYLSCDFCNHATMHLMAGLLESHDRERFEIFAYDYSRPDVSEYRTRFLKAVEHHVDIKSMTDAAAAARIAEDRLDILFDLKGHTGWGRLGILAYRPAPIQTAFLGFPGSTATTFIDYLIGDRVVTPDSSAAHYTEKFCRLPNSYQCNDRRRPVVGDSGSRASHGLPGDAVVYCMFNQSYKIDRVSFGVWMRVLKEVPDSVLWLLHQDESSERNLRQSAREAGVAAERLIFSPFASPERHIARMQLADACLDTLICNGHTTTSDTLWAGVPVVTARGSHFCSRVSESLLRAMDLPELVGADGDDMVRIAARIGNDAVYRRQLREKVAVNRLSTALFDTERYTRNFERAIVMMVEAARAGQPPRMLDVPEAHLQAMPEPAAHPRVQAPGSDSNAVQWTDNPASASGQSLLQRNDPAMKFNLGCGNDYRQGWINVDKRSELRPDLIVDLEQFPWPIEDDCADEILLRQVLEQLGEGGSALHRVMQELYRISKPDAIIHVQVRHPRHDSFLAVPAHARPILPETFSYFDLATAESWQESREPRTSLAKELQVDFERTHFQHHLTPYWLKEFQDGRINADGILRAIENDNNVVEWTDIALRVRKPFRPGSALRTADAICLERHGGMGEVVMALAAAKALKSLTDRPVVLVTAPAFQGLAAACPHVDAVANDVESVRRQYANLKHADLNPVAFGISRFHQVDAYLQALGLSDEALPKGIEINVDASAQQEVSELVASWPQRAKGRARILFDVQGAGANVTWPPEQWQWLATELLALGHQVVTIGSASNPVDSASALQVEGVLDAVNRLTPLALIALMRQSDLLVSTDGDSIQLAGASDIGIVGLFSVAAGSCRLPFRNGVAGWRAEAVRPSCRFHPCYRHVLDDQVMAPFSAGLQNGTLTPASLFASWCPDGGSYACMKDQITVPRVLEAIGRLDSKWIARRGGRRPGSGGEVSPPAPKKTPRAGKKSARTLSERRRKASATKSKEPPGGKSRKRS